MHHINIKKYIYTLSQNSTAFQGEKDKYKNTFYVKKHTC